MNAYYLYGVLGVMSWQHKAEKLRYVPNILSSEWQLNSDRMNTCFYSQEEAIVALPAADDATKANPVASTCSQTLAREKVRATTTLDLNSFAIPTAYPKSYCKYRRSLSFLVTRAAKYQKTKQEKKQPKEAMLQATGECTRRLHNLAH